MGARSRVKGAAWQAELARRWRESGLWPLAASTQGAQTRSGRGIGLTPPDVEGTPFAVEAKHEKRANPIAALVQSEREAGERGDARPAIAVVRPHGTGADGAVVIMKLPVFELLAEAAQAGFTMADLLEVRKQTRRGHRPAPPPSDAEIDTLRNAALDTLRAIAQRPVSGPVVLPTETGEAEEVTWVRDVPLVCHKPGYNVRITGVEPEAKPEAAE
jgi:hypothetical protein